MVIPVPDEERTSPLLMALLVLAILLLISGFYIATVVFPQSVSASPPPPGFTCPLCRFVWSLHSGGRKKSKSFIPLLLRSSISHNTVFKGHEVPPSRSEGDSFCSAIEVSGRKYARKPLRNEEWSNTVEIIKINKDRITVTDIFWYGWNILWNTDAEITG
jgi:hypothetical protein